MYTRTYYLLNVDCCSWSAPSCGYVLMSSHRVVCGSTIESRRNYVSSRYIIIYFFFISNKWLLTISEIDNSTQQQLQSVCSCVCVCVCCVSVCHCTVILILIIIIIIIIAAVVVDRRKWLARKRYERVTPFDDNNCIIPNPSLKNRHFFVLLVLGHTRETSVAFQRRNR